MTTQAKVTSVTDDVDAEVESKEARLERYQQLRNRTMSQCIHCSIRGWPASSEPYSYEGVITTTADFCPEAESHEPHLTVIVEARGWLRRTVEYLRASGYRVEEATMSLPL